MARAEKRRSDRLMLTIPLRVTGVDDRGQAFEKEARTINLNRHGARIQLRLPLKSGQVLGLVNLITRRGGNFRVVGPTQPYSEGGGEWGVECLDAAKNIWGIQFPAPLEPEGETPGALLECRTCHTVALTHLSLVEVEVLESAGIFSRRCEQCGQETPWGYAETQIAMQSPPEDSAMSAEAPAAATGAEKRRHRRVSLQLPVLIRDYYGGTEVTKSENVSKGGFCFASEKSYLLGAGIMVVCPYSATSSAQNIEVRARIVRRRNLEGTNRIIYGVRYDPQAN